MVHVVYGFCVVILYVSVFLKNIYFDFLTAF